MSLHGACRCGAVRIHAEGEPITTRACWCADCQAIAAGGPTHNVFFPSDAVTIDGAIRWHASNAFACATVWAEQYGWKGAVPGYLAASFVAGSRLALKKHRLSDVVGGATLGVIVGRSVVRWDRKPSSKPIPEKLKVTLGPATALDGSGLGLRVDVVF